MKNIKLIATDLDGTFLKDDRSISSKNLKALHKLGEKNIVRVAATGRNFKKVQEVVESDIPFDFIVFSSGAGIYDWNQKKHIFHQNIDAKSAQKLFHFFVSKKYNFHAFYPVPQNHKHWYFRGKKKCEEFERYFTFNKCHATELKASEFLKTEVSQFLLIIPEDTSHFQKLKKEIEGVTTEIRVIRTSSPITRGFIWMEVFHRSVSKANGVKHICNLLKINKEQTISIGNDFNDLDLLAFTQHSFLTENAPREIKNLHKKAPSNENDAFARTVQILFE